jgi:hypothetical protein
MTRPVREETAMFRKLGMTLALAGAALVLTTSLAVAAEGMVTKMDDKGAMVRMGDKEHMVGMIPGAKVGDKVMCTEMSKPGAAGGSTGMPGTPSGTPDPKPMQMTCTKM